DTIVDTFEGLQPIAYRSRASTGSEFLDFTTGHVTGWLRLVDGDSVGVDAPLPQPVYNSATFDVVLRASPLRDGFAVEMPGFLASTRGVAPLSARVTGTGLVAQRDCWIVRAEFAGMPVTFWIDVNTRQLRQQVMQVRPGMQILFTTMQSPRATRRAT
ncbi:MAG: hypothetical protein OEY20_11055, partial [Gemmatimonadota bacterium]|nr:hypothetical protein [Gemmatimonadota bacterium]